MIAPETLDRLVALAVVDASALPPRALQMARFSLFDWMVCARAGVDEPVARIVRDLVLDEGGRPQATLAGTGEKVPPRAAALSNGTTSHALDYDDTHFAHVGHPSVGIYPAALAVGELVDAPAARVAEAFLVGAEASCRIGMVLGRGHYDRGFHQTATAGAFGATVAAGRLIGLDDAQMANALGLVATRASGLKSQFGTMGKPFNAGISASNGVEAALLASRGFVSARDGVGGPQGFVDTHADSVDEAAAWADPPPGRFVFEDVKYKFHACCHGTHAMIEALAKLRRDGATVGVEQVTLRTNPRWLKVCDIKDPRTGLELKFAYGYLAAMVIDGVDTAAETTYTDALAADPRLGALSAKVKVLSDPSVSDTGAIVSITGAAGTADAAHDLSDPIPAETIAAGLRAKARAVIGGAAADKLWSAVEALDGLPARALAAHLVVGST
jgi:2-methylcitrate dehydratase PrpD